MPSLGQVVFPVLRAQLVDLKGFDQGPEVKVAGRSAGEHGSTEVLVVVPSIFIILVLANNTGSVFLALLGISIVASQNTVQDASPCGVWRPFHPFNGLELDVPLLFQGGLMKPEE